MANESPTSDDDLRQALTEATAVFARRHVNYALVGGMAVSHRSQPRFTKDVDFLVTVPALALPPLLEELQERGFEFDLLPTIREWTQHHMVTLSFHGIRIDWLKPVLPVYQHILDKAQEEKLFDHTMRVASVEGLLLLKLLAFRLQDQIDIENLIAAHKGSLDLEWIRGEWQALAPLDDPRLKRLLELAS
jgi:Nucleotidyl transferase of unknown function (DUF2204)